MKCRARFSAIADFPVPHVPFMKINLFPLLISSRTSWTMSFCVLLFENFRGSRAHPLSSNIESGFGVFLYSDHIFCLLVILDVGFIGFVVLTVLLLGRWCKWKGFYREVEGSGYGI